MTIAVIAAVSRNGVIGRAGKLPWHLSTDLKRFKALTTGHAIIMGRKTYESIGRPLPQRRSIVITRNAAFRDDGVEVAGSLDEAIEMTTDDVGRRLFVIGGEAIFAEALPRASELCLTRVHADVEGDAFFPELDLNDWQLIEEESHPADAKNDYPMTLQVYRRRPSRER